MSFQNVEDIYPLSPVQHGMALHSLLAPESGVYTSASVCTIRGNLDVEALRGAWQHLIDHHAVLRSGLPGAGIDALHDPYQVVYRRVSVPLELHDWRGLEATEQEGRLAAYVAAERRRGFDLAQPPLMRLALFRIDDDAYTFVRIHHHLMLDGWSAPLLYRELFSAYAALVRGDTPTFAPRRPYRDYIAWLQQQDLGEAERHWRQLLAGFTTPTPLVQDRPRRPPSAGATSVVDYRLTLSEPVVAALREMARARHLTLNTIVQGAWALLLSRYSGEEDVVFGAVVSGRPAELAGVEQIVGLFLNTLPVRARIEADPPVAAWLASLQEQTVALGQYQYSPLSQVQEWSDVPRGQPLFESILVFENLPGDETLLTRTGDLTIADVRSIERSNYALTVYAYPRGGLALRIVYDPSQFSGSLIGRMAEHFRVLLEGIAADPNRPVGELPLLTPDERRQLLVEWNATPVHYPLDRTLTALFEAQVDRTPEATALIFGDLSVSYRELDARSNRLARHLRDLGVAPSSVVGVCVERSPDLVVAVLGILKTGAAYLPLDPSYPPERLDFMLEDARAPVLLTTAPVLGRLPEFTGRTLRLDRDWAIVAHQDAARLEPCATGDDVACLIYTSGSTGRPKGVENTHRSLVNTLWWQWEAYPYGEGEVACQKTALSFGDSIQELFAPLLAGVPTVLVPEATLIDPDRFVALLAERDVSRLLLVPSLLRILLDRGRDLAGELPRLRLWVASGEALPVELARRFQRAYPDARLVNLYGQSEAAYDATAFEVEALDDAATTVPIGRPIANVEVYLLDRLLRPVPVGAVGEICVGGVGLARGYWNRPELTAARFVPHPFRSEAGTRLLRTGDLGRYRVDGVVEYVGRLDEQVKVRGVRVELGEIEHHLSAHPHLAEAAVTAWEERPGEARLVAYLAPAPGSAMPTPRELRAFLKQSLPDAMVPAIFVPLAALPRTPNGKLDRPALPAPTTERPGLDEPFVAPTTPAEQALAAIWREVLRVDQIGIHDNFFDLGGASFEVLEVASRAAEAGLVLSPELLFVYPTVAELADLAGVPAV